MRKKKFSLLSECKGAHRIQPGRISWGVVARDVEERRLKSPILVLCGTRARAGLVLVVLVDDPFAGLAGGPRVHTERSDAEMVADRAPPAAVRTAYGKVRDDNRLP